MKEIFSISGIDIFQRDFNQIMIRGNEHDQLNQIINKEVSLNLPNKNLQVVNNDNILIAKHSFDQWNLIYFNDQYYKDNLKFVSNLNSNNLILASDYSYGQVYFDISGEKKNYYLNKLTHFDLRLKKFPVNTMAQTLIARIDCSIYHLKEKYIVTCNKSFEDYFIQRLTDSINL
tara:strand:- start:378 stop:899 length:522 start_codon:yes stop_codon:yes gene_type:complete